MYSVDLSKTCYRRPDKPSGFLLNEIGHKLNNIKNHKFLLGQSYAKVAEEIGGDIDFLVLDTTYAMPGEFLDFISALPFLKDGAVVVLHDVSLNLLSKSRYSSGSSCNRMLLSCVSSDEKYFNYENPGEEGWPNIGAFVVNQRTKNEIENVFQTLSLTWSYMLDIELLTGYRELY